MSFINRDWLVANFNKPGAIIFDIGAANLSDSTLYSCYMPEAQVYAFECAQHWMTGNLAASVKYGVHYFHCAVSDVDDEVTFYPSDKYQGETWPWSGSTVSPSDTTRDIFDWGVPYTVRSTRLDTFCSKFRVCPDFIHMDVQGAEFKVLSAMGMYRPKVIWTEIHCLEDRYGMYNTGVTYAMFLAQMKNLGYSEVYQDADDACYILDGADLTPFTK
jgi:FkbM family methyltransferase